MRCWAFGPDMRRCDEDAADHPLEHSYTVHWKDEESLTFNGSNAVVTAPIYQETLVDSAFPSVSPSCFSCGCPENAHQVDVGDGELMCAKHQCRSFLP